MASCRPRGILEPRGVLGEIAQLSQSPLQRRVMMLIFIGILMPNALLHRQYTHITLKEMKT